MMLHSLLFIFVLSLLICSSVRGEEVPKGHLQPLGSHRPKEGLVESRDDVPSPRDFYYNYVVASKPVIFRGAGKISKGYDLWTDEYLRLHYGEEVIRVDYGRKENRARSADDMKLAEFLKLYNNSERYLVDTLPKTMWSEFSLPKCLLCGGFTKALQDSVLWFSGGGTKSHLHSDKVENINCLLSGEKEWFFVDEVHSSDIEMDHQEGDYCSVDVDKVDMYKYPSLRDIPWWSAHLHAGDCMYVPYGWVHQVKSLSRNIAVNIWWAPMMKFNDTDCEDTIEPELHNFRFTHGEMLRFQTIQVLDRYGGSVTFEIIHPLIVHEHSGERLITRKRFALLDTNKDGLLIAKEINNLPTNVIEQAFGGTPPGEVNIIGKSREEDRRLAGLLKNVPAQPPHIEEFLLRPDKSEEEIEVFLNAHGQELPEMLRGYLLYKQKELHVPEHEEL